MFRFLGLESELEISQSFIVSLNIIFVILSFLRTQMSHLAISHILISPCLGLTCPEGAAIKA